MVTRESAQVIHQCVQVIRVTPRVRASQECLEVPLLDWVVSESPLDSRGASRVAFNSKGHKLYRNGLAVVVRHPNYYGDLLIFSGWSLMSNNPWILGIPAFQFCYFYFVLIPKLDEYLKAKYGRKMYEDYEYHVKGLIPFLL